MASLKSGVFGSNCDLDFTATINVGDSDPTPGDPDQYWSIFPFCQNVSSNTGVLPPEWTHSISSTGDDLLLSYIANQRNTWGGNDYLTQAASRYYQAATQGLQWPATGL